MIEKLRTTISKIFVLALIVVIIFSKNYWEIKAPIITIVLFFIGIVFADVASLGRLWCSLYIAGYKIERLVTEGPYSICRNPLYLFSFIGATGVGLASETFSIPLIVIIAFSAYYPFVIKKEEERMAAIHKKKFSDYISKTPRFFPKISDLIEPDEYVVRPIIFRRHLFDAIWFIWIIGILELIEGLHELNIIPTLFTIY